MMRNASMTMTLVLAAAVAASAQDAPKPKPSQLGGVTQQINDTEITLEYSRPVARGRALFGELVPWGKIWTPGANDATTIVTTTEVTINGKKLAAGKYTVWSEPGAERWTLIFNAAHPVFHLRYADVASKDVLRVSATPRTATHMETLAWYFPVVEGRKAELVVHWGTVVVPLEIEVP